MRWLRLASFGLLAMTACPGSLDPNRFSQAAEGGPPATTSNTADAAPAAADCGDVVATIFDPQCKACHSAALASDNLDLVSPGVASRVVGKAATSGGLLADPAHPEDSVIYKRVSGTTAGARMPSGGTPLSDPQVACVLAWIKGLSPSTTTTDDGGQTAIDGGVVEAGPTGDGGATAIRVAAGASQDITDSMGNVWKADNGFSGGTTNVNNPAVAIDKTDDDALYNDERWGNAASFQYQFMVPNGKYTVTLKFAETYSAINAAGLRTFNASINGDQVLTDFDIFKTAGALNTATDQTFQATVTDGTITVQFSPGGAQNPKVNALSIVSN